MYSSTPKRITLAILDFCKGQAPVYVSVDPWKHSRQSNCFVNVEQYPKSADMQIVNGWIIWETPKYYLEAEAHALICKKGKLLCITPHKDKERTILFLPDSFVWEGKVKANRFYPLTNNVALVALLEQSRLVAEWYAENVPAGKPTMVQGEKLNECLSLIKERARLARIAGLNMVDTGIKVMPA